ncbi:MAG TPA: hemolysin III family protein [Gemmatimonadaceae bacterium]|nr:hemolysin III family protein [Gemmatimonadaceae bacterium]
MARMNHRPQTTFEEIANCIVHGAGLFGSLVALPVLMSAAAGRRDPWQLAGSAVFGLTLVVLYLASTLYHAVPASRAKHVLRVVDHSAIYLLIAGTYTPFMLGALRGPWGWTLLVIIWALALAGIGTKLTIGFRYPRLSTALYLLMGWLMVVGIQPLMANVSREGILWLLAGGLCYTGGVVFYVTDARIRFGHALWHVFVLAGSVCHFVAVLGYAAPAVA